MVVAFTAGSPQGAAWHQGSNHLAKITDIGASNTQKCGLFRPLSGLGLHGRNCPLMHSYRAPGPSADELCIVMR